jgi:tol-pal system protein YbgF
MPRAIFSLIVSLWLVVPAGAQTQQEGEMLLYIQQLEARVRQLTGENEQLAYEINQLRAQLGMPPMEVGPGQTGALTGAQGSDVVTTGPDVQTGVAPQGAAPDSVAVNDPLNAPDGAGLDSQAPIDLSTLAGGSGQLLVPGVTQGEESAPVAPAEPPAETAAIQPTSPAPTTALSGSARDEYDLAYGYILTGDYALAEEGFKAWLAAFPNDPQAADAEFWLGESHLQQGEYRDAAAAFLAVYKAAPDSSKGPDALLKLGVSLSALGEKPTACATFAELGRRYPRAAESVMSRVRDEKNRAGCTG